MLNTQNEGKDRRLQTGRACGALAIVLAAALAGCTPPGPRALLNGKRLMEKGDYAQAVAELSRATSLLSTNAEAWNDLAVAEHHCGKAAEAARDYQRALRLDPDLVEAHFSLGCLWLEQNRPDLAKAELTAYTLRRANAPEGWLQLGLAQLRARDLAAAQKSFSEASRLNPKNAAALNGQGVIQFECSRPRNAALWFYAALRQEPDYAPALLNLAIVAETGLGNRPLALREFRSYLALNPRPANWQAVAAAIRGMEPELDGTRPSQTNAPEPAPAIADVPKAPAVPVIAAAKEPQKQVPPALRPENARFARVRPQAQSRAAGEADSSLTVTTTHVAAASSPYLRPEARPQKHLFARLFHREAKPAPNPPASSSEPAPMAGLNGPPRQYPRYPYRNPAKPVAGDLEAAERVFAQGARAHEAQHYEEAVGLYRQATQLDPAFYDAYYNLGLAATATGELHQALQAYETALAIRPGARDARYNFALLLAQAGYPVDAAHELEKILQASPDDAPAHLALGNLCAQQLGLPDEARQHYRKFLELKPADPHALAIRDWLYANYANRD